MLLVVDIFEFLHYHRLFCHLVNTTAFTFQYQTIFFRIQKSFQTVSSSFKTIKFNKKFWKKKKKNSKKIKTLNANSLAFVGGFKHRVLALFDDFQESYERIDRILQYLQSMDSTHLCERQQQIIIEINFAFFVCVVKIVNG